MLVVKPKIAPVISLADLAYKRIQRLEGQDSFEGSVEVHVNRLKHADRVVNFAHAEMIKQKRMKQGA
jgi:hypothetical protein